MNDTRRRRGLGRRSAQARISFVYDSCIDRVCDRACRPVYPLVYCVCIERVSQWRISNRVSDHVSDAYLVSCIARCVLLSVWRVYWPTY